MQLARNASEIAQRDRFLERTAEGRRVYVVLGSDGLARVPSRRLKGREVTLMWSDRAEAERWATLVAENPRVKELTLAEVLSGVLPKLQELRRFVGVDWSSKEVEPESDASDVAERLRIAALGRFVKIVKGTGQVWTLEDANGPAFVLSATRPDMFVLPCWADRSTAENRILDRIDGPWRDMMALEIPLKVFIEKKLPWLAEQGRLVAPEHLEGAGALELEPRDLAATLGNERKA